MNLFCTLDMKHLQRDTYVTAADDCRLIIASGSTHQQGLLFNGPRHLSRAPDHRFSIFPISEEEFGYETSLKTFKPTHSLAIAKNWHGSCKEQ